MTIRKRRWALEEVGEVRRVRSALVVLVLLALPAGCGGEDDSSSGDGAGSTAPTTLAPSSTDPPITATAVENPDAPIIHVQNLEYLADGEGTWTLDVAYPDAPGPWPLYSSGGMASA